jgi:hypothetical protein
LISLLAPVLALAAAQETRIDDVIFDQRVARHLRAMQALEREWKPDPAAALPRAANLIQGIEIDLDPALVETTLSVRFTRGIDKGQVKERHAFFPYRLAGEIALGAGEPEKAAAWLRKSPGSAKLLETALAAAEKRKPAPAPKPALDLAPFLARGDFSGAVAGLGPDGGKRLDEVRRAALDHQRKATGALAAVLPRLKDPDFRKEHLGACLAACAKVPAEWEIEELRWVRRLDRWMETRDPAELERLAAAAAKFAENDFHTLCEQAQRDRLAELERLVEDARGAPRGERAAVLDRLGAAERALGDLLAARPQAEIAKAVLELKGRLPVDDEALDEARKGVAGIGGIRRLADQLERLWISERRARLSVPDQKDLASHLGLYRCYALFLEGRTIEEAAKDPRVAEVFRQAGALPAGASPKVAAVRALLK